MVVSAGEEKVLLVRYRGAVYAVGTSPPITRKSWKGGLFGPEIVCKSHLARPGRDHGADDTPPAMSGLPVYPVRVERGRCGSERTGSPGARLPRAAPIRGSFSS